MSQTDLPAGTVTFVFAELAGAAQLLRELGTPAYENVLARLRALVATTVSENGGSEVDRHGDAFFAVFTSAPAAVSAAYALEQAVGSESWPDDASVRLQLGVHTGDATLGPAGYVGLAVHEASRLADAAEPGQLLISAATAALVMDALPAGMHLQDFGRWRLDGFDEPRRVYTYVASLGNIASTQLAAPSSDLYEREREMRVVESLLERRSGFVVAEARAGLGKTRLLQAARELAVEAGWRVLSSRGAELEHEFPYGVVRQLLEPALRGASPDERRELLAGPAAIAESLFDDAQLPTLSPFDERGYALMNGLYWFTANLAASQPTLVIVDDLHWADAASLRWLSFVAPRLEGLPFPVLCGTRPPEQSREAALVTQVLADPSVQVIRPGPLGRESIARIARATFDVDASDEFVAACRSATGGNPLYVRALLDTVRERGGAPTDDWAPQVHEIGPRAVTRAVQFRLARLPGEATALARAIAVLGSDAELERAAELAGLTTESARAATADLARVDIIHVEYPLRFVHPVVRASVYDQIEAPLRMDAHRRAAKLVADTGAPPERVAAHLLLTDGAGDAFAARTLRAAGARALARGASDGAVAYLTRALEEPPPPEELAGVLFELGMATTRVDAPRATEYLRRATELADDPSTKAEYGLEYGRALWYSRDHVGALAVLRDAIANVPPEADDLRERLEAEVISSAWWDVEMLPVALDSLARIDPERVGTGVGGSMLLASLAFQRAREGVDRNAAVEYARRALATGLLQRGNAVGFHYAAYTLTVADHFDEALTAYDDALTDARLRGDPFAAAGMLVFRGFARLRLGDLDDALGDLSQAAEVAREVEIRAAYPYLTAFLSLALLESGDVDGAWQALRSLPIPDEIPRSGVFFFYRTARGAALIARGEREQAVRELRELGELISGLYVSRSPWGSWRVYASRALLELGERREAVALAQEEVEGQRAWGAPRALGVALTTLGVATGGAAGEQHLAEAVQVLEESPAKLARGQALFELGASLRRRNQRVEAREFLRRALELADACGAKELAAKARDELHSSGARPRSASLSGLDALTPSELRVARMAATGALNREIAQALFVTPKTVEVHLSSAYRKLGIASRMQLADALGDRASAAP